MNEKKWCDITVCKNGEKENFETEIEFETKNNRTIAYVYKNDDTKKIEDFLNTSENEGNPDILIVCEDGEIKKFEKAFINYATGNSPFTIECCEH